MMAATSFSTPLVSAGAPLNGHIPGRSRLTRKERQLLEMLVHNSGRCISRETLLTRVWGYGEGVKSRTVDVHIQRLRRKLPQDVADSIKTIVRAGYCWLPQIVAG